MGRCSLDDFQITDDKTIVKGDRTEALRRSPGSSMSLMRTSVISTVVLLAKSQNYWQL